MQTGEIVGCRGDGTGDGAQRTSDEVDLAVERYFAEVEESTSVVRKATPDPVSRLGVSLRDEAGIPPPSPKASSFLGAESSCAKQAAAHAVNRGSLYFAFIWINPFR
jgi:hypothetical protein